MHVVVCCAQEVAGAYRTLIACPVGCVCVVYAGCHECSLLLWLHVTCEDTALGNESDLDSPACVDNYIRVMRALRKQLLLLLLLLQQQRQL